MQERSCEFKTNSSLTKNIYPKCFKIRFGMIYFKELIFLTVFIIGARIDHPIR
jgi:hypothetical protein